ncbi:MAG: SAM-dependent methyltransferase [Clostridia bacterium]|nr:SAM-dependent methyltransferase [Clostridia bacterium]
MSRNTINLNPRLKKIADLVPANNCTADIGTDHAYIPIVLAEKGICPKAIASDIKKGPLARAEANIKKHGLSHIIETRLGAGLETLAPGDAEVIIIAGMGGILISDILEASRSVTNSAKLLVLQPMTAVPELRAYLSEKGYTVLGEYLEAEEDKLYNIIVAHSGGKTDYTLSELYLGKNLSESSPELFPRYKDAVLTKLNRRADGLRKSETEESKAALFEIEKILKAINTR